MVEEAKKRMRYLRGLVLLLIALVTLNVYAASSKALREFQDELVKVIDEASKSVVTVLGGYSPENSPLYQWYKQFEGTPYEDLFKQFLEQMEQEPAILGSGVIVTKRDGEAYIVTNSHVVLPVINNNLPLRVKLYDGTLISNVRIVKVMTQVDLALLQVPDSPNLKAIKLGDSSKVKVGQIAIAIGNPFGLEHTVTLGIISATGRKISTIDGFTLADMIQTDAALNPGNSGGALININGELIGINTAIYSPTRAYVGIGFAIPSNVLKKFLELSLGSGAVAQGGPKPYLGVLVATLPLNVAYQLGLKGGVMIVKVKSGSPADKAGLLPQDIIVSVDGNEILSAEEFVKYVMSRSPGDRITLKVFRAGRVINVRVKLASR